MTTDRLDDPDFPAYTTGQAAQVLGVRQAFLGVGEVGDAVIRVCSGGAHPRYSRRQLVFARRVRELFDQGHNLASALRILSLQDDLATERDLTASLRDQLRGQRGHGHGPADDG
jgi:MerR family transcriptional regulator, heat shock protein HspR